MWARYMEALKSRPIRTNTATALCINFVGDIMAQNTESEGSLSVQWERTWTVASYGMVTAGPGYYWFRWLDQRFPLSQVAKQKFSGRGLWMLTKKLTVHLGIFAPTINAFLWMANFERSAQRTAATAKSCTYIGEYCPELAPTKNDITIHPSND